MKIRWWGTYIKAVERYGRPDKAAELCKIPMDQIQALFRAYPERLEEVKAAVSAYRLDAIWRLIQKGEDEGVGVRAHCYLHRINLSQVLKWAEEYPELLKRLQDCIEAEDAEKSRNAAARKERKRVSTAPAGTVWVLVSDWGTGDRSLMGIFTDKESAIAGLAKHIDSYDKQWVWPVVSEDDLSARVYSEEYQIVELPLNKLMEFNGWATLKPPFVKENA
jgi:hypothetical protein